MITIDHLVFDDYARNSLLHDSVINSDGMPVANNVIQGSGKPCSSDCSNHAMIGDVCLPRRLLEADTIYRELRTGKKEKYFLVKAVHSRIRGLAR